MLQIPIVKISISPVNCWPFKRSWIYNEVLHINILVLTLNTSETESSGVNGYRAGHTLRRKHKTTFRSRTVVTKQPPPPETPLPLALILSACWRKEPWEGLPPAVLKQGCHAAPQLWWRPSFLSMQREDPPYASGSVFQMVGFTWGHPVDYSPSGYKRPDFKGCCAFTESPRTVSYVIFVT